MSRIFNSVFRRGIILGLLRGANMFKTKGVSFSIEDERFLQVIFKIAWWEKSDDVFTQNDAGVVSNLIAEFVKDADASRRLAISHFLENVAEWYRSDGGFPSSLAEQVVR